MDGAGPGRGEASTGEARTGEASAGEVPAEQEGPWPVHALFQQRVAGDDALLKLAGLRFAQMGVAAEVYADGANRRT